MLTFKRRGRTPGWRRKELSVRVGKKASCAQHHLPGKKRSMATVDYTESEESEERSGVVLWSGATADVRG